MATNRKKVTSTQVFLVAASVIVTLLTTVLCIGFLVRYEVATDVLNLGSAEYWNERLPGEQQTWFAEAVEELRLALTNNRPKRRARSVLLVLVRGISVDALAAARFIGPSWSSPVERLSWESFPHVGRLRNSCSATDVCDAFTQASALFTGVRGNSQPGSLGMAAAAAATLRNCSAEALAPTRLLSVLQQAQEAQLRTGFVTTERVTGSAMAALYAHGPPTNWECDAAVPRGLAERGCDDVARQLLAPALEARLNVAMGGGRQALVSRVPTSLRDPLDERVCLSRDGRNLVRDWQRRKLERKQRFAVLHDVGELRALNASAVDHVLGIFANGDLQRDDRCMGVDDEPSLQLMAAKAGSVVRRPQTGYLLVLESAVPVGGTLARQAQHLRDVDAAIREHFKEEEKEEDEEAKASDTLTLVVVTSGHYVRGTLDTSVETEVVADLRDVAHDDGLLEAHLRRLPPDTLVYANGPHAHLFHSIHDETYLAHAVSYALRIGPYRTS